MKIKFGLYLLIWMVCLFQVTDSLEPQVKPKSIPETEEFLQQFVKEHNKRAGNTGIPVRYDGDHLPIPQDLEEKLKTAFPNESFVIAKLDYFHWTWRPGLFLILTTDANSGQVKSYCWDLWFSGATRSFVEILAPYHITDPTVAQVKLEALAGLLVFPTKGNWETVKTKASLIEIQLNGGTPGFSRIIRMEKDGGRYWRVFKFINPVTGKAYERLD